MKTNRPAGFLNVDLEIESLKPLSLLADGMGKAVIVLHAGRGTGRKHLLCLESSRWPDTPDATARDLCRAVERLSSGARKLWDGARRKEFNFGYDLPCGLRAVQVTLHPETVQRIVALGATVAFTCYRGDDNEPDGPENASQPIRLRRKQTPLAAGSRR